MAAPSFENSQANAKEEEEAAKAAMIKALEEDQAAVRRALAEAQADRAHVIE